MFLLLLAMLSVSTSPIIARYLENVPAVAISFWRMGFGAVILWFISFYWQQPPLKNGNLKKIDELSTMIEGSEADKDLGFRTK